MNSVVRRRVLVVDDEADLRELLELTLVGMGLDVDLAADIGQARSLLTRSQYSLCMTDMRLPDGTGLDLLGWIVQQRLDLPVAVITAYGSAENAVAALKAGAFDYLAKPVSLDALRMLVKSALPEVVAASGPFGEGGELVGQSAAMQEVKAGIARVARSMAPVAITGESGSGKELVARRIHQLSPRASGAFVAVNCGAIPEQLMESEFFGHKRGAFTGADQEREGFFQAADGGTLFLDEVADLPLAMQVKLLRAIQEKRVRKIGATAEEAVDVRIISATHQNLAACVQQGRFRQDLFYRLNVIELRLPALRERSEDVPALAQHMLQKLAQRAGLALVPKLSTVAERVLQRYAFPGNVRELENVLERALAFSDGVTIMVEDLGLAPSVTSEHERELAEDPGAPVPESSGARGAHPPAVAHLADGVPDNLPAYLDQIERDAIMRALEKAGHNRTAAAKLLGISFRALRYRLQRLGI